MVRCVIQGCIRRAKYSFLGRKRTRCATLGGWLPRDPERVSMMGVSSNLPSTTDMNEAAGSALSMQNMGWFPWRRRSELFLHKLNPPRIIKTTMVRFCVEPGCLSIASFNFEGKKAIYCARHRKPGMANQGRARCANEECQTWATFRVPGKKETYCMRHKVEGAIQISPATHRQCCGEFTCTTNAIYSLTKESPIRFCRKHAPPGVKMRFQGCSENSCTRTGSYSRTGTTEDSQRFCAKHKKKGMAILISKRCKSEGCPKFANVTVNGVRYCREHGIVARTSPSLTFEY